MPVRIRALCRCIPCRRARTSLSQTTLTQRDAKSPGIRLTNADVHLFGLMRHKEYRSISV